jgi:predicted DNA-binding transcriptional regulator YafY
MKLDRLIAILVILLRKERVQAKELADMLGVSVRTILRDVDAINLAGIPVVTYQGINGDIGIAGGYRLDKSVLTSDEMAAVITTRVEETKQALQDLAGLRAKMAQKGKQHDSVPLIRELREGKIR